MSEATFHRKLALERAQFHLAQLGAMVFAWRPSEEGERGFDQSAIQYLMAVLGDDLRMLETIIEEERP